MGRGETAAACTARTVATLSSRLVAGVPDAVDAVAAGLHPDHAFLRAAWFTASGADATLLAELPDGLPVAALPTAPAGPVRLGVRAVVGSYWPFRSVPVSPDLTPEQLTDWLAHKDVRAALGPLWRLGPFYADDPAGSRLFNAAAAAGWTVMARNLGRTYLLDIAALRAAGPWPRPSTLKRIRNYERQLAAEGELTWERIEGAGWTASAFDTLAEIENASWIADRTDGSGAKFANAGHRAIWEQCAADPALAAMMSAVVLRVGGHPAAFCFDLNAGTLQYSIAGSYDARFARLKAGKVATYRNIEWAIARGIKQIDWGAGDSGYKREIGAAPGPRIIDCLFVRSPFVASMLRKRWERSTIGGEADDARKLPLGRREWLILASLATAAAAGTLAE